MGRSYTDKKIIAEDCRQLSINDLVQWGYLKNRVSGNVVWKSSNGEQAGYVAVGFGWGKENAVYMRLRYVKTDPVTKEKRSFDYTVDITETSCNYGWHRYWFKCPLYKNGSMCGRRVERLYLVGGYFGCRHCQDITYASRNENKQLRGYPWRVLADDEKREKLRKRMKYKYYAGKPTKTYAKLLAL